MSTGGYQIIDLENYDFSPETAQTIVGVYAKIEGTRKPILLSNIVVDGKEFHDVFISPKLSGTTYSFEIYDEYNVSITDNDEITFGGI